MSKNHTTTAAASWKVGDVVRYSDMANSGSTYIVIEVTHNPWNPYRLRSVDAPFAVEYTHGRQAGWEVLS